MAELGSPDGRRNKAPANGGSHELDCDHVQCRDSRFNTKRTKGTPSPAARKDAIVADPAPKVRPVAADADTTPPKATKKSRPRPKPGS